MAILNATTKVGIGQSIIHYAIIVAVPPNLLILSYIGYFTNAFHTRRGIKNRPPLSNFCTKIHGNTMIGKWIGDFQAFLES